MSKTAAAGTPAPAIVEVPTGWTSRAIGAALITNLERLVAVGEGVGAALHSLEQQETTRASSEQSARRKRHAAAEQARLQAAAAEEVRVRSELKAVVSALAPGPAVAPWGHAAWNPLPTPTRPPGALRIGLAFRTPNEPRPPAYLIPLLSTGGLMVWSDSQRSEAEGIVQGVVLRALASFPRGRLEIHVYDPEHTGALGALSPIRDHAPELFPPPMTHRDALRSCLESFRAGASRVAEQLVRTGEPDLASMETALGQFFEPHRLLVLLSYPTGLDEPLYRELVTILSAGPRGGIMGLVVRDSRPAPIYGVDLQELDRRLPGIRPQEAGRWVAPTIGIPFVLDPPPPANFASNVAREVGTAAKDAFVPSIPLLPMLPVLGARWKKGAATGGLRTQVGKVGMSDLFIELRTKNPPLPNLLVGGTVGQGKSNFLLVLVYSLLATYSPDELELYVLDLKQGLEFDRLGPKPGREWWAPHVRALGLDVDLDFALAVLRHVVTEYTDRATKLRGSGDYDEYRTARPDERLPRIVLVIDEFQVLFSGGDRAEESVRLLETLARLGRACGIHLVLASQSLTGIQALKVKEDAIFGQFPWRVCFKTSPSESEALLGQGNREASHLRFRGEAIVNQELGNPDRNKRAVIAWASNIDLDTLAEAWWRRSARRGPPVPPRIVRRDEGASLPDALRRSPIAPTDAAPRAWLGMPVDVKSEPVTFEFAAGTGRTLAVLGEGEPEALAILGSALHSCGAQARAPDRVVLLDLLEGGVDRPPLKGVLRKLEQLGHAIEVVARMDAAARLFDLAAELDGLHPAKAGRPVWIVVLGGQGAVRWAMEDPQTLRAPREALQRLLSEGPVMNRFVLGWWSSYKDFEDHLGFNQVDRVRGRVLLEVANDDLRSLCGPYERWRYAPWRALFWDPVARGGRPIPFMPFAPRGPT